jgi:hypothetical protein
MPWVWLSQIHLSAPRLQNLTAFTSGGCDRDRKRRTQLRCDREPNSDVDRYYFAPPPPHDGLGE